MQSELKHSKRSARHGRSELLSTRALAHAIGVSESSIKRWADDGTIRSARTAGGHRRIPRSDAIRFVRETHATVLHPEILGLAAAADVRSVTLASGADALTDLLLRGAERQVRGLLEALYLRGESLAAIFDGPLRAALDRIGELWRHDAGGIFLEHRAITICVHALGELGRLVPALAGAPVAVGGAVADDPYLLPSMAAALVLGGEGFDAVDLGADVPLPSLVEAMTRLDARLVWVSASTVADARALERDLAELGAAAAAHRAQVVIGGRAVTTVAPGAAPNLSVGRSMGELAAFARGLRASAA